MSFISDDAIKLYEVNSKENQLGGFFFTGEVKKESLTGAEVFTFKNPYRKVNKDVLFLNGSLYITEAYGDTVERTSLHYVKAK